MSESPSQTSSLGPAPSSWTFWKKRLARFFLVGGLVLLATQLLPELPQEQHVLLKAPPGARIVEAGLTYFLTGETEALAGARLQFSEPVAQVPHSLELPNGRYRVDLSARGLDPKGQPVHWKLSEELTLDSKSSTIRLPMENIPSVARSALPEAP